MHLLFGKKSLWKAGKILLLTFLGIQLSLLSKATDDPERVTVFRGKMGELVVNTEMETVDDHYYDPTWFARIKDPSKDVYLNTIALLVDEKADIYIPEDFDALVKVGVTWTDKSGTPHSIDSLAFTVSYKKGQGAKYDARNSYIFDNARKVKVTIQRVDINSANVARAMDVLRLENRMRVRRDYIFDAGPIEGDPMSESQGELWYTWDYQDTKGHTHVDIEWAWVDAAALSRYESGAGFDEKLIYKNNSTRVTVPANYKLPDGTGDSSYMYKIPLLYDGEGYLFYRIRPMQYAEDGNIYEGEWSEVSYYHFMGHENELNWQATTSYAEDGKRKSVVQYFDGTMRNRQTVTKDNVTNTTIVAETMYDYQGRPAINILPAPTLNEIIGFAKNFNHFESTFYPKDLYDKLPGDDPLCEVVTPTLDSTSGSSRYYSSNNEKVNEGFNQYISSAHGYPYTETLYTPDATGRIAAQGGVGPVFQINKQIPNGSPSREIRYYYGSPDQKELDALFGTEVGKAEHYFKNMVRDANGQYSVSYVDMHGRTIATALAGMRPANVDSVDYVPRYMTKNLLTEGNNTVKDRSIVSSSSIIVTKAGLHTFHYELSPQSAEIQACNPTGQTVCYDCVYDLQIRITGNCLAEPIVFTRDSLHFPYDTNCSNDPTVIEMDFELTLAEGEYNVTKTLSLSTEAQLWYRDNVFRIKNICKTLQEYYDQQYSIMIDSSDCAGNNYNCDTCHAKLGDYEVFRAKFLLEQGITDPGTVVDYEKEIKDAYDQAAAACDALCPNPENETRLAFIRQMMLDDMIPGRGQYALLDEDLNDDSDMDDVLGLADGEQQSQTAGLNQNQYRYETNTNRLYNIFNPIGSPLVRPYTVPRLADGNISPNGYPDASGAKDADLLPNPPIGDTREAFNQFASVFKDQWAENLLYYHPEYKRYKFAEEKLGTSYTWDAQFQNVENWADAEAAGYTTSILTADPFIGGAEGLKIDKETGMTFRALMARYLTVEYRNSGKTLWQLAWIAGNCPDPITSACLNTPSSVPPFTFPGDCESDKNKTWEIFRNIYLSEKENMISRYLDKEAPFVDYALIANRHYQRRLGAAMDLSNMDVAGIKAMAEGNNPSDALNEYGTKEMEPYFQSTCEGYVKGWEIALSQCTQLDGLDPEIKKKIIKEITDGLTYVCVNGSDMDHPLGASTVRPNGGASPASFEEVIKKVFAKYSITATAICHPYMITSPAPYEKQVPIADDVAVLQQDSCLCTRLTELQAEKAQNGYTGTLSQFIKYQYGVNIRQGMLDTLTAGCSGDACKFYDPPFSVPAIFSCGVNASNCIDCQQYSQLKTEFKTTYPSYNVVYPNPDGDEEQQNRNMMFQQFMNYRTGLNKSWTDYLAFEQLCNSYDSSWSCNKLDSIVAVYYETHSDTLYGSACQASFAAFFNSAFSTAFSFAQIQSLFMQHCGHMPDVCQPLMTCTKFQQVVDSFYVRYGAAIAAAGNCQALFVSHFNDWFGTDYTYAQLQDLYNSLCGGALDVCGHFDCSKLQAVLDSWTSCHRVDQLDNDCFGEWVTYFNGMMSTGLTAMQIDSLYRACNIPLMPCQPPVTCKALNALLRSYENAGASACQGSGLDSLSSSFCTDCFAWYVNDRLGTSYSLEQIKALYKQVCGTDLQVCGNTLDCNKLTAFVKTYLAWYQTSGFVGNCDSLFTVKFNQQFSTSYTHAQIMSLYQQYCGKLPTVCFKEEPVSCTQLQKAYNDFKQLYPQPSFYFGDTCQAAFTQYFNQYFGDTLTWNDIRVYYLTMCGQNLDVCNVVPQDSCLQVQRFMADYSLEFSTVVMPKQACIDVYSRLFNRAFTSRVNYQWKDIERIMTGCGQSPPGCLDENAELNADRIMDARKAFYAYYYEGVPKETGKVFTEFFNQYYRTSFTSYDQIDQWTKDNFNVELNITAEGKPRLLSQRLRVPMVSVPPAPTNMPPRLCGIGTLVPTIVQVPEDPCAFVSEMALNAATEEYNNYVTQQLNNFDSTYQAKCLSAASQEVFTMRAEVAEYHYTLYYYDQAGNLVKTVPPAGVNLGKMTEPTVDSWHAEVEAARITGAVKTVAHTMATEYRFNTLNQVVAQKSPDGGLSHFWYDRLGRLVVSQNEKQELTDKFSYTKYDELGRITEVGQLTEASGITQATAQSETALTLWFNGNDLSREQITKTVYDISAGLCESPHILCQRHLRNRVSYTYVQPTASFLQNGMPYHNATYYTYDIHGNVDTLLHHYNDGIMQATAGNAFKRIAYKYDLISGKVNEVIYQPGVTDQFYHRYEYDAENKLTAVLTSPDSVFWERQAAYEYYKHGPLARSVVGELQVQGVDYAYTLQGWLKGINSNTLEWRDMGGDANGSNSPIAKDVYSYSLNYFADDYKAIKGGRYPFIGIGDGQPALSGDAVEAGKNLYNGNINSMLVNIPKLGDAKLYAYRYDQLNRLKAMNTYTGLDAEANTFTAVGSHEYKERIKYDGNGNITHYLRNGFGSTLPMDDLSYTYIAGRNQLDKVTDVAADAVSYNDIKSGQLDKNYEYDSIGNLVKDKSEGLYDPGDPSKEMIEWTVYGKISKITKIKSGVTTVINYTYDATGNRISQVVNKGGVISTTWYVRDAGGNTMAVYQKNAGLNGDSLTQSELYLYGSNRLGVWKPDRNVAEEGWSIFDKESMAGTNGRLEERWERGNQQYELSNHLGNVLVAISDRNYQIQDIISHQVPSPVAYYEADIVSASDYYPGGMQMVGRTFSSGNYRYGFNGQEKSTEIDANGNSMTAEFWQYDARIGRRWNVDPKPSVDISEYATYSGNPIRNTDPRGDTVRPGTAVRELAARERALKNVPGMLPGLRIFGWLPETNTGDKIAGAMTGVGDAVIGMGEGVYNLATDPVGTFKGIFKPSTLNPFAQTREEAFAMMKPYMDNLSAYGEGYANFNFWGRVTTELIFTAGPLIKSSLSLSRNTIYRFDTRSFVEIEKSGGFNSWGHDMDLFKHATGDNIFNRTSGYVSTSFSLKSVKNFAKGRSGFIYTIEKPRIGFDVNKILGKDSPFPLEMEFAVPGEIPLSNIKAVKKVGN